ncbi:MAG TPA: hypothetical protein VEW69_04875 [Alphaproteobacteria bacterium]|nr:hypothetical protein [Alphaproteobacteria bacterium]
MRSEYVFAAAKEIGNRFLLCRVASVSARRLHQGSRQPSETINNSLMLIAAATVGTDKMPSGEETTAGAAKIAELELHPAAAG